MQFYITVPVKTYTLDLAFQKTVCSYIFVNTLEDSRSYLRKNSLDLSIRSGYKSEMFRAENITSSYLVYTFTSNLTWTETP